MSSSLKNPDPRVFVVTAVHNRRAVTERLMRSLAAQTMDDFQLVLVDDGSTDGTAEMAAGLIPRLTLIRGEGDWWWAGSLQQAFDWLSDHGISDDTVILITNDDGVFEPDFLAIGLEILATSPRTMLQATILSDETGAVIDTGIVFEPATLRFRPPAEGETPNCLTTNGLFTRWGDLRRVGGFHPRLLPHYLSDYEYTIRAGRKGMRLMVDPRLRLRWNQLTSGYRTFNAPGFREFLDRYFSTKSVANPLYWSTFILLTVPMRHAPRHLMSIWSQTTAFIRQSMALYRKRRDIRAHARATAGATRVVIGAGGNAYEGWISIEYPVLDVTDTDLHALFAPGSVAAFLAEHVWEHLDEAGAEKAARNCHRFLKTGGHLRLAVPDGLHPDPAYIEGVRPGGSGPGADDHKVLYDYRSLTRILERAGFRVRLIEWFDEHQQFHAEPWEATDGFILRSTRHDPRNKVNPTAYTSLMVDAIKDAQ